MDGFEAALEFVLGWEGGYVDDPRDPGGETQFGISKRAFPDVDVRNLTREQAAEIYRREYWERLEIGELPELVRAAVFDTAVNCGRGAAAKLLQEALNAQGAGLAVDGDLGPRSRAACTAADTARLLAELLLARCAHYLRLAEAPRLRPFLRGWLTRTLALRFPIGVSAGPNPRFLKEVQEETFAKVSS